MSAQRINLFLLIIILSVFSCRQEKEQAEDRSYREVSENVIGEKNYYSVLDMANDSLALWKANGLPYYEQKVGENEYVLDSLLCFNQSGDKMVGVLLGRTLAKGSLMDGIVYFYGLKIKGKWIFFQGSTIYLPRERYQKDRYSALSFSKLHEIATKEIFAAYLKKNTDEPQINNNFFDVFNKEAYNYPFTTQKSWEDSYLRLIRDKWKKLKQNPV